MYKKIILISIVSLLGTLACIAQTKPSKVIPAAEHYEGGQDSMYAFINRSLVYPQMAKRNRIEGECIIKLKLEADGTASAFVVVKNIGGGCGEEAMRVIKLLKFKAPGYSMQTSIPVIFSLKATK